MLPLSPSPLSLLQQAPGPFLRWFPSLPPTAVGRVPVLSTATGACSGQQGLLVQPWLQRAGLLSSTIKALK